MTTYEIIAASVQLLTLFALIYALYFTVKEFKTRLRPYLGFEDIIWRDITDPNVLEFDVIIRNVGSLPAKNAQLTGTIKVDKISSDISCETKGSVFPSQSPMKVWIIGVTDIDKMAILGGTKTLKLFMEIEYYGNGKRNILQQLKGIGILNYNRGLMKREHGYNMAALKYGRPLFLTL